MKFKLIAIVLFSLFFLKTSGQKLKNGTYEFSIRDTEYEGHQIVAKCKVIINGEKIKVIYIDSSLSLIKYGEVFDEGILLWHKRTKQWIIGHSREYLNAKEVGGCSDGPRVIDLKKRELWNC